MSPLATISIATDLVWRLYIGSAVISAMLTAIVCVGSWGIGGGDTH